MPTETAIRQDSAAGFRHGDMVTVRSLEEILATLDADAKFEGLPFMPEMAPYCGRTFKVFRRADKTCVEGIGIRSMRDTVFLEGLRCNGSLHDGCQRGCLFFWKNAWLKAADRVPTDSQFSPAEGQEAQASDMEMIARLPTTRDARYYCQSTELAGATTEMPPGKLRHYLHDLRVGEISPRRFTYMLWMALTNRIWRMLRGRGFHQITGEQKKTLSAELNLQPGELVEIKSPEEIQATLDARGRNRGLTFEPEMALHCGRRYRVATPVRSIILEENGTMAQLTNTVILDGLVCEGICSKNCPRANYLYWREIWLKRVV